MQARSERVQPEQREPAVGAGILHAARLGERFYINAVGGHTGKLPFRIAAGLGIGFWPEKAWGGKPGHGVVLIPIRYPNCRRDLVVTVFDQAGNKPVVDEFVNYFCKYFEKDPSGMGDVTV